MNKLITLCNKTSGSFIYFFITVAALAAVIMTFHGWYEVATQNITLHYTLAALKMLASCIIGLPVAIASYRLLMGKIFLVADNDVKMGYDYFFLTIMPIGPKGFWSDNYVGLTDEEYYQERKFEFSTTCWLVIGLIAIAIIVFTS